MLLTAGLIWVIARFAGGVEVAERMRCALGLGLIGLGAVLDLAGVVSCWRASTTINPLRPESTSALVTTGLFRFSRNPIYVGYFLVLSGWVLFLASPWSGFSLLLFVLYLHRFQIVPEERALRETFGEEYDDYCARVRRWV